LPGFVTALADLPLHAKHVLASANTLLLRSWARDADLQQLADEHFGWLSLAEKYSSLLCRVPPSLVRRHFASTRLSSSDISTQIELEKYERPDDALLPCGKRLSNKAVKMWCRIFTVNEVSKRRRRHICEPVINDCFSSTATLKFMTWQERRAAIARFSGGFAVSLDWVSAFDQFLLDPAVRPFFGIKLPGGSTTRMRVLPMGFRRYSSDSNLVSC
jgi:hypothetical protein